MSSGSQRSPSSDVDALELTSQDLVFPSLPVHDEIRRWAEDTSESTGVSATDSPLINTTLSYEIMSALSEAQSDDNSLAGSTYEFIDTDEESRDGNATESIASTDFGRPDEVTSVDETEHSGEESGDDDEEDDDPAYALQEVGHNAEVSSVTSSKGRTSTIKLEDPDKPLNQAIEFEEPLTLGVETISVKHTVIDYTEEQTEATLKNIAVQTPPKRLALTIRQTMTKQGLSTRDPLRILYVGSHAAKQDIIHKIAGSVTASVNSGNRAKNRQFSQLYNVVPVSAFGSEKTPEIELMHSSGYQIKVEDAISARSLKFEDSPEKPDVLKLTLDDNFSYHSVPEGQGFIIEPTWEVPHVGIFYCSDNDDADARRTMSVARKFMGRHSVPSIVISHKQLFDRGHTMSLDQHAIHMCLESRDPNGRGSIVHRRLPVDLASFLNIDARQMNRNLAYITGLHESLRTPTQVTSPVESQDLEKTPHNMADMHEFASRTGPEWRALLPVSVMVLSVLSAVLMWFPAYTFHATPSISINSKAMSAVPLSTSSAALTLQVPTIETIFASNIVRTATRTITVTQSHSPQPNSLSVLPSKELGSLSSDTQSSSKSANKSSICSAQVVGDGEILIRMPSATKLSWLVKEALSVNITRGNVTVDTERAYSSNDGIVLLIPKKEAYGVLNVSIITSKKPRVNETFQVDFGSTLSQIWQSMLDKVTSVFADGASLEVPELDDIRSFVAKAIGDAQTRSQSVMSRLEEARKITMERTAITSSRFADVAKDISLAAVKQSAILTKEITIQYTGMEFKLSKAIKNLEGWREPIQDGVLKAQVQSRLLWLKMIGDDKEYLRYQERAAEEVKLAAFKRKAQKYRDTQFAGRSAPAAAQKKACEWKRRA